jgi:hypothetical protein
MSAGRDRGLPAVALLAAMMFVTGAVAACGSGSPSGSASGVTVTTRARAGSPCPSRQNVLVGAWDPHRLTVLNGCQPVAGTVEAMSAEQDGDVHFDIAVDPSYRRLLSTGNFEAQHGWLVVELMPRDGSHLPEPAVGDRVALVGAWVNDTNHSWHEIYPVFSEAINGGPAHTSGPQYGGSPPSAGSSEAPTDCRTTGGARCPGYAG